MFKELKCVIRREDGVYTATVAYGHDGLPFACLVTDDEWQVRWWFIEQVRRHKARDPMHRLAVVTKAASHKLNAVAASLCTLGARLKDISDDQPSKPKARG